MIWAKQKSLVLPPPFFNFEIKFFFNYRKPKCQNTFKIYFDDIEGIFWTDFSIDNLSKDNFKIPSNTRQLFIVWHLWNLLDTWKTTRSLRCFCTPQRIGNLECWKLSHHKITLQGTTVYPTLRKPENHLHDVPWEKGYDISQEGIPIQQYFLVYLKFVSTFITFWYTDIAKNNNKNPSIKTWTATKKIILGNKTPVQCKQKNQQCNANHQQQKINQTLRSE